MAYRKNADLCCASHPALRTIVWSPSLGMEDAMGTINLGVVSVGQGRGLRWSQVRRSFAEWRGRARSRNELMGLNDRVLQDIGVSRCTADFEASKPFWMA